MRYNMTDCLDIASTLATGALIEPIVHPKPGAVTALVGHRDKSIIDYTLQTPALVAALYEACRNASGGFVAEGMRSYRLWLKRLGIRVNLSLGTVLMLLPLAAAARVAGAPSFCMATRLLREHTSVEDSIEYYKTLRYLAPSHLGRYRGPLPDVSSGASPPGLWRVLEASSVDNVHWDMINCYPLTRLALSILDDMGLNRDAVLTAILTILAEAGDTLIMRKYGLRAFKIAIYEARLALNIARRTDDIAGGVVFLDRLWRPRGWSPGSTLDIVATAISVHVYNRSRSLV